MGPLVFILGGYGGAGRAIARTLLQHTPARLVIGGRNGQKARAFVESLRSEFPGRTIEAGAADAADTAQLHAAFVGVDWVIFTTTMPEYAARVADAALDAGASYLDILVSSRVPDDLAPLRAKAEQAGKYLITQGGFHPGLPAPLIRYGAGLLDQCDSAVLGIAMCAHFETPESSRELIFELADYQSKIVVNGQWRQAGYRDMRTLVFEPPFGARTCTPLSLPELEPIQAQYHFREFGLFIAGFNWVVDYLIFPVILLVQSIKRGACMGFLQRLLHWGVNTFSPPGEAVEMRLHLTGLKNGAPARALVVLQHPDPYLFTAIPVVACLQQLFAQPGQVPGEDGAVQGPGVQLMGLSVEPSRFFKDLETMGIKVSVTLFAHS